MLRVVNCSDVRRACHINTFVTSSTDRLLTNQILIGSCRSPLNAVCRFNIYRGAVKFPIRDENTVAFWGIANNGWPSRRAADCGALPMVEGMDDILRGQVVLGDMFNIATGLLVPNEVKNQHARRLS